MKKFVFAMVLSTFAATSFAAEPASAGVSVLEYKMPGSGWKDGEAGHALGCFVLKYLMNREGC